MLPFITLDGVTFRASDGRTLFDHLTVAFAGERTGLVGANGSGKTTLLRLMLGELTPRAGSVARRGRIGVLRQDTGPTPWATVGDLLEVAEPMATLARIETGEGTIEDLELAHWDLVAEIESALVEVGLAGLDLGRPAASLSGGEATRAALARLLIQKPDMVLLDEPTNNLDRDARADVARVIEAWPGGAVVVSHDRALLRRMDRIVELSGLGARVYGGGFDLYVARRDEEAEAASRALESAARDTRRIEREIQATRERQDRKDAMGLRAKARGGQPKIVLNAMAGRAEGTRGGQQRLAERRRTQAADQLEQARARVEIRRGLGFELPGSGLAAGRLALAFENVEFAWPGRPPILKGLTFRMTGPARVAVTGPNGSGKTTLIRLATGDLAPSAGTVTMGVPAVALDQRAAVLRDDQSLLENFRRLNPQATDNAAHTGLARFLFRSVAARRRAGDLSGGERLRAALACLLMAARPPQLIVLDEPTNHLDLESIEAIEQALAAYDGGLLIVSHDEDFLAAVGVERILDMPALHATPPMG